MSEEQGKAWLTPRSRALWRIVGKSMAVLGFGMWLFHFYMWYRYVDTRPDHAVPSEGRTHVMNNHGIYRYLTKQEDDVLTETTVVAFSLLACGGVIYSLVLGEPKKPKPWEKKQF